MEHLDNVNKESTQNTQNKEVIPPTKKSYEFDKLQLYFAEPYTIQNKDEEGNVTSEIKILQPTIGDIVSLGETKFYNTLYIFILNTTSYRLQLWDMGIDWNKISDYELFCMLLKGVNYEVSKTIFGDIIFSDFGLYTKTLKDGSQVMTLYNQEENIEIDENTYAHIAQYLRTVFNIFPKVEKTKGKTTKEWLIEEEREKLHSQKDNNSKSMMLPLVSTYLNHPGTKYKKSELREVGIFEFMDSIQRIQIYESTVALTQGMYSGMISTKDIDKEAFNFMREK